MLKIITYHRMKTQCFMKKKKPRPGEGVAFLNGGFVKNN